MYTYKQKTNNKQTCSFIQNSLTSCIKNEVNPNAAGALWSMMAKNMISSTSVLERPAAAPNARPSASGGLIISEGQTEKSILLVMF